MSSPDTKQKILDAAIELFAQEGFDGSSVRQIAQKAGVNLAAINYHYKSKDNLYWAIFERSANILEIKISKAIHDEANFEDNIFEIFKVMIENGNLVKSTFQIILSNLVNKSEQSELNFERCGPPGESHIKDLISSNINWQAPPQALEWAVHSIFTNLAHNAMIASTDFFESSILQHFSEDTLTLFERSIKLHAKAILDFLNNHKEDLKLLKDFKVRGS